MKSKLNRYDIAIVGAGPAGSSAAISLAKKGYSVVLVDKATFPRNKLCGDFLNPINWPIFERLGMAADLLELEHDKITGFRMTCFTGEELSFTFPHHQSEPPFGLGINRYHFDHLLVKAAQRAGAIVREGRKVNNINNEQSQWEITLADPSGEETIETRFLIGADGRNSAVARRMGVGGPVGGRGGFVGFQLYLRGVQRTNHQVQIHLFPGGYAGLGAVGDGITNLCFSLEKQRVKNYTSMESILNNCLFKNPHLKRALEESVRISETRSTYPVHTPRRRSWGEGFILAGDAAYGPEPVTGEGIYFALRSAELASEVIHEGFVRGDLSIHQTSRYGAACESSFARRERMNRLNRWLVYRPYVVRHLVRLSSSTSFPIKSLIDFVVKDHSQPSLTS